MQSTRWWNLAFGATIAVLAGLTVVAWAPTETGRAVALLILGAMVAAYLTLGLHALRTGRFAPAFTAILIVGSGALVACSPNLAIVQAIAFPLLWSIIESTRRAIAANVVLGAVIVLGFLISLGTGPDAVVQALTIESISVVGSIALGLWITRIAELSHERQRLLDELTASQNEVAALNRDAGMLGERERLAREIHDTIAQDLTGLVMLAQRAQREADPSTALALLEENARAALAETRALVAASAPVALGDGIVAALTRLGESFGRETGVSVTVNARAVPELGRDTEVVLLRCAQEALGNVRKHSGAAAASIDLTADGDSVTLRIADDGGGFDPDAATDGFGLAGMRDRLALVGGALDVATAATGTTLTVWLPAVVRA